MKPPPLLWLTGASGSGKTTIVKALKPIVDDGIAIESFDSIGVPSVDEMRRKYGSPSNWQRAVTDVWIARAATRYAQKSAVVIEGQSDPRFVLESAARHRVESVTVVVVHCDDLERHMRLRARGQRDLVNADMDNWAAYLKGAQGVTLLDTTKRKPDECATMVRAWLPHTPQISRTQSSRAPK
jgi:dephospho-CoA kinase